MAWYQPKATPPDPLRYNYRQEEDPTEASSRRRSGGNLFSVDSSSDDDNENGYGVRRRGRRRNNNDDNDELQRRIETLLSPMLPSSAMASTSSFHPGRQYGGAGAFPSFRYHESPPPPAVLDSIADDEVQHFFYPRPVLGRGHLSPPTKRLEQSNITTSQMSSLYDNSHHLNYSQRNGMEAEEKNGRGGDQNYNSSFSSQANRSKHLNATMEGGTEQQYNGSQYKTPQRTCDDEPRYGAGPDILSHSSSLSRTKTKQLTLVQDPKSGKVFSAAPVQEAFQETEKSWDDVGKIGTYNEKMDDDEFISKNERKNKKKKKKEKKKKKRKEKETRPQTDISTMLSEGHAEEKVEATGQILPTQNKKGTQEKEKAEPEKKRERKKRSRKESQHLEAEVEIDFDPDSAFYGIEECSIRNAASNDESLRQFLSMVKMQRYVAWTIIFLDHECSTSFLPSCEKYCTPKGPRCRMWNCICDNQVRAMRASAPVLGAMFVFPDEIENEHGADCMDDQDHRHQNLACFILPLGPTMTSEGEPESNDERFSRMARWPVVPFECDASLGQRWDAFRSILLQTHIKLVTFNAVVALMPFHFHRSNDYTARSRKSDKEGTMDLILPSIWDLRLASWILMPHVEEEQLEMKAKYEGLPHLKTKSSSHPPPSNASKPLLGLLRAREDLEFLFRLYPILDKQMEDKGLRSAFDEIEGPVQSVLSAMECTGIGFHPERFLGIQKQLEKKIDELTAEARFIAKDNDFLLSSPQQVSHLLFDVLKLTVPQGLQTKIVSGSHHRSTSEEALKAIQAEAKSTQNGTHRIIDILLEFRKINKLLTSFIRPLPNFSRAPQHRKTRSKKSKNGVTMMMRIHPQWMQTAVRTGRLSCRKPNMQQIPTEGAFGLNPRDGFVPTSSEKCLFACDYSQNEIRILAHMSNDHTLISMFQEKGVDIYKQMSSAISGKPTSEVTDKERKIYKQVTLAILYGMGIPQVAKKLGVTRDTAGKFFKSFYQRFHGVRQWMDQTKEFARRNCFVTTIAGRRRYLDDINSTDKAKKAQAERQAVNTIIQGSAADLIKLAMLKMASRIMDWRKEGAEAGGTGIPPKILLQIHDELLFEVMANEADVKKLKNAVMRCCDEECVQEFKLKVPLSLKCSCGISWGLMKEM